LHNSFHSIIGKNIMLKKAYVLWLFGLALLSPLTVGAAKPGELTFSEAEYTAGEQDGTVKLKVSRVGGSDGKVTVDYASSDETAKDEEDYDRVSETLKWKDGDTSDKIIKVPLIDDNKEEDKYETFIMKLSMPTGGAFLGSKTKAVVTIVDDDQKLEPGTLQFSNATYSVDEDGGSVEITVTRINGSDGKASVKVVTANGSAKKNKDFKKTTKKLKWADGDDSDKTFTVNIIDDSQIEGDETFKLKLKKAKGAKLGSPKEAEVTIIDNDPIGAGILRFSSAAYDVDENGGSVKITVNRAYGSDGAASVDVVTSDGSADNGEDYEKITENLKWAHGDGNDKTFAVPIFDDFEAEGNETFNLELKNAQGAKLGSPKEAEVTIADDDKEICNNVVEIPTIECEALLALYKSTDGANWDDNSDWNVTDTPCDWEGVTCKNGHVSRLYLYSNNLNGEMPLELGNLTGLERLFLDDNKLSGAIPFELGYLVKLNYLRLQNNNLCGEIPNELMEIGIPQEPGYLNLYDNYLITYVSDELKDWLDIRNPGWDDAQRECPVESNSVQFVQGYYDQDEDEGFVTLKVSRVKGDGAISVRYTTSDGTATAGDYEEQTGTLSWGKNDFDDKEIQIGIINDCQFEEDETFDVKLSIPSGGAVLGTPKRARVLIRDTGDCGICEEVTEIDKDECKALITLYDETDGKNWDDNTGWKETNTPCQWAGVTCKGGHVSWLYLHSNNLNGEIPPELNNLSQLKRLLLSGNALSGVIPHELGDLEELEYLWLKKNSLCGDIPELLRETSIPPDEGYLNLDNNHLETDVSDKLRDWLDIRNPGWDETQTDCPPPSVLQFSRSRYSVNESKGTVILTVTRTGSSKGEVSVVCATSDDSAIAGYDYNESFEVLTWADGDSEDKICQIDILDDNELEGNETFVVGLGYPDGAELGIPNTAVVTVGDESPTTNDGGN
jgi:hypothetical protein